MPGHAHTHTHTCCLILYASQGVSVRKSVVNIVRDILLYQPLHPRWVGDWVNGRMVNE